MAILGKKHVALLGAAILASSFGLTEALAQSTSDVSSLQSNSKRGANPNPNQSQEVTIWDLFRNSTNPNTTVEVNKYLWFAALDILNFLPVETVDPFTGVIVMGYGTPPGGGRSYRATVYVQDPALDARSIKVAIESRGGGAVPVETQRAIEDAIMTRARQLRIQDSKL